MFGSRKATHRAAPVRHCFWRNSVSLGALIVATGLGITLTPASAQQQGGAGGAGDFDSGAAGGTADQPGLSTSYVAGGAAGASPGANGGDGPSSAFVSGGGGGGGASGTALAPVGGNGGNGGPTVYGGSASYGGGGGGAGGHGYVASGPTVNSAAAQGGNGGNGSNGQIGATFGGAGDGGGGGDGGYGLFVNATGVIVENTSAGSLTGGDGGNGGVGQGVALPGGAQGNGGNGGNGGAGFSGTNLTVVNAGIIAGGNGGLGGGSTDAVAGLAGLGGSGITGSNLTIVNNGLIVGGVSGDGLTQADGITFTSGANRLTMGAAGDIFGNIAINGGGSLTLDQSANDTAIYSDITGNGSVEKVGTATVLLAGFNTYSGGTTVTEGTLELDGPQPLGVGVVTMNGGTLRVSSCGCGGGGVVLYNDIAITARGGTLDAASGILAIGGNITGGTDNSVLTITGDGGPFGGFVVFGGYNTYRGWTHITADGILWGISPDGLSPNSHYIVDGILDMGGYDRTFLSLSGASTGQVGSTGFGPVTLTIGTPSGTSVYDGIILDGGPDPVSVVKTGAGKQVLNGINSYTGSTTVNEGVLSINGSIASSSEVIVNSGGTLSGNGIVSTTTINAGGTLAPGNSIGTLTVQGDLTFKPGSTYQVEVSPSNADRVNVTGIAALNGATLSALYAPGAYVTKRYTVLNAAGGVNGTFSGPVNTNLPTNFSAALNYDPNNAYLDLTLNYMPPNFGGGLTVNQTNVANALVNSFNTAGGIPLVFGALGPSGLTQASGESATGVQQSTINVMDRFLNLMTDPYASGRTTDMVPMSYAPLPKGTLPLMVTQQTRWSVWAAGYGGTQTTRGNSFVGSNTYTGGIYGFAAGADYRVSPDTIIGFALGGAGTSYHLANGLGSGSSNVFQAGLYGRQNFGAAYLAGSLAYGWQDVTTDRRVMFDQLRARFTANAFAGRLEAGYRLGTPFGGVTPYAAGQFTNIALPNYSEQAITGPGLFALNYASKNVTAWRTELGLRGDTSVDMGDATLWLRGRLAWAHNYNPNSSLSASFLNLPASSFVVNGAAQARNAALVSAGAEMKWRSGWSIAATFEGEFSGRSNSYAGKGSLRYQW
ncbi:MULTISPECIES: autotransporter domain-containing protein [unclassified Beijerinckia]|uniref:autotransporter outer membrane beta-barrel domain-containing protein n=1 Tax=unclassified Beijerinckia TaxID=2638183 RepID=UPI00089C5CF5|nr:MULTISPECIES: autotransporter domain-containing protein [unclassified Beijerinckia]MDH7795529.1 autotransporter-associated beta strand protein [Beijerinckia sp. GAS462]SEC05363.1 autotransporter-associated beta strand repeat-containing protein [Beijerinckia sp. 28-YEA-48]